MFIVSAIPISRLGEILIFFITKNEVIVCILIMLALPFLIEARKAIASIIIIIFSIPILFSYFRNFYKNIKA